MRGWRRRGTRDGTAGWMYASSFRASGTPDFSISHPPQHAVLPFFFADVEEEEPEHRGAAVRDGGIFLSRLSPDDGGGGGGGGGSSSANTGRVRDAFATWQGALRRIMDN